MSVQSGKRAEILADRLKKTVTCRDKDDGIHIDKPDFRERDLGSPISPLRARSVGRTAQAATTTTTTTTSSSSSSSGSASSQSSAGPISNAHGKSDPNPKSYSGEFSVDSSPARRSKLGHTRSHSWGSHPLIFSGSGSVNSPPPATIGPTGNICPSGRILKASMASKPSKPDVLGLGSGNYGHGSIMRGGSASKPPGSESRNSGGVVGKRMGVSNGSDPEELKIMGNESYRKGHFSEALTFYEKAIAIAPSNASYHFNKSAAFMGLRLLVEAVRECEEAIRLDPGYVRAHHRLGSLFVRLGLVENARKHICVSGQQPDPLEFQKLQTVEKHLSSCTNARRVGNWKSALREVDEAIASGADASAVLFACKAEALLKLHQLDDAFLAWSNLPKHEASSNTHPPPKIFGMLFPAYIFFVESQVEFSKGRFDGAVETIEKASGIDPHNVEISTLMNNMRLVSRARARGNNLYKSERFTEACSAYGEGLRIGPSNSVLYCNRAACWFKLGKWERSIDDCNQALRIQPNYEKALLRRAASNAKLECWSEALRDYVVLRRQRPDDKVIAESLFHAQVALKKSRGEEVHNTKFGVQMESVSGLQQFQTAISSPGVSAIHYKTSSNVECKQISPFLDALCDRYPSIKFLKVDIEENPSIATAENVSIVPTFKIYRNGNRVMEMISPSTEVLESSIRHYTT